MNCSVLEGGVLDIHDPNFDQTQMYMYLLDN